VLSVGSLVDASEAAVMATQADSGVVYADSFDHLLDPSVHFTDRLAGKICGRPTYTLRSIYLYSCVGKLTLVNHHTINH